MVFYECCIGLSITILFCWITHIITSLLFGKHAGLDDSEYRPIIDIIAAVLSTFVSVLAHQYLYGFHVEMGLALVAVYMFSRLSYWAFWRHHCSNWVKLTLATVLVTMLIFYDKIMYMLTKMIRGQC